MFHQFFIFSPIQQELFPFIFHASENYVSSQIAASYSISKNFTNPPDPERVYQSLVLDDRIHSGKFSELKASDW